MTKQIKDLNVSEMMDICDKQTDPCVGCPLLIDTSYSRCVFKYLLHIGLDDVNKFLEIIHKEVEVE